MKILRIGISRSRHLLAVTRQSPTHLSSITNLIRGPSSAHQETQKVISCIQVRNAATFSGDGLRKLSREEFWQNMYESLLEYREKHGDCLVPTDGSQLGKWVDTQRQHYQYYKDGRYSCLNPERIKMLEKEGFVWEVHSRNWLMMFQEFKAFKKEHGHQIVPVHDPSVSKLYKWILSQRHQYVLKMQGKTSFLTKERYEALESEGFTWNPQEDIWMERLEELKAFKADYGHCMVPQKFLSNPLLSKWVGHQRNFYSLQQRGKTSPITAERIKLLNEIGFVWNVYDFRWAQRFEELKEFGEANGHFDVSLKLNRALGKWIILQKKNYEKFKAGEKTTMNESRISKLHEIGFIFNEEEE